MQNDIFPTTTGLLRCLQALAEETASLGLLKTYLALTEAIAACRTESGLAMSIQGAQGTAPVIH